jgi:hypothetical protein
MKLIGNKVKGNQKSNYFSMENSIFVPLKVNFLAKLWSSPNTRVVVT